MLRSQHVKSPRKPPPEERLMIAVLQEALDCLEKNRFAEDLQGRRLFDEAKEWLLSGDSDWPYSFVCICRALDLDPSAVRRSLGISPATTRSRLAGAPLLET